jgi:hypothetical protein
MTFDAARSGTVPSAEHDRGAGAAPRMGCLRCLRLPGDGPVPYREHDPQALGGAGDDGAGL